VEKLVRDRIPDLGPLPGQAVAQFRRAVPGEMIDLLLRKVREEVDEVAAEGGARAEELADVLEVLRALAAQVGLSWADVEARRVRKLGERGGFTEGWVMRL
jgi:predicted house-cleaning noncanonical NTP pyrophosphatase (MazG superfamily)